MTGSDGLPSDGKPHPRLYGTMARASRSITSASNRSLTLEEAVRKMTSLPARKHRIARRGVLREGAFADIVVFDPGDDRRYRDLRGAPASTRPGSNM